MKFLDQAKIFIQSGKGGNGCVSFRRENMLSLVVQMAVTAVKEAM